jgi:glycosyltransferase involved in cell wall biosynthesis
MDVALLTLKGEGRFFVEISQAGVPTACARMARRSDPLGWSRAWRAVRSWNPDVIVTWSVSAQVVGHLFARAVGARHVTTEHIIGRPLPRHRAFLVKKVAPRVDKVVGVSEAMRPELEAFGYRPQAVQIIRNGVANTDGQATDRGRIRSSLGIDKDQFLAVLVAMLRPEKQPATFVKAVAAANQENRKLRGLVVGGGPAYEEIRDLASETGESIAVLGPQDSPIELMKAADVVCLSSVAEGLPMVLLEAMSVGRPVVATRLAGIEELVVPDETGILVPPGEVGAFRDALLKLAANPERAKAMGAAGLARQRREFSESGMVDAYADVFRTVAGKSTPAATRR